MLSPIGISAWIHHGLWPEEFNLLDGSVSAFPQISFDCIWCLSYFEGYGFKLFGLHLCLECHLNSFS